MDMSLVLSSSLVESHLSLSSFLITSDFYLHSFFHVFWGHVFDMGWCTVFCFRIFNMYLDNWFRKIWVVLRRTYESEVVRKKTFYNSHPEKDQ